MVINKCNNVHIGVRFSTSLHVGTKYAHTNATGIHVGIKKYTMLCSTHAGMCINYDNV